MSNDRRTFLTRHLWGERNTCTYRWTAIRRPSRGTPIERECSTAPGARVPCGSEVATIREFCDRERDVDVLRAVA